MSQYWTTLDHLYIEKLLEPGAEIDQVAQSFQIKISPTMQQQISRAKGEEREALLRQFIPSIAENHILPEELDDPIGDGRFTPVAGVVHRYPDRALLKITQLCEVYCRFCFRKEMIGQKGENLTKSELQNALDYFAEHQELWEVILTGGDPLILSIRRLREVLLALAAIPHLKSIRIHSRIPLISPEKISPELLALLDEVMASGKMLTVVLHANHAAEFSPEGRAALRALRSKGVMLLSQSVLLKGVNDNLPALKALMYTFVENGVKPYYLHQMDLARGTSHFVVSNEAGIALINQLREEISGICIPRLIIEIPEGEGKRVLA
ncbi:KamA family radical SAM protein [Ignatzschineria cameli]|uniref:Lysine 2,3-aminomutase n=1 Tax=Ignatzschineria cameli TaxID=2182793 RepID=A0A2U2AR59_9GAMM|nr:KamA family radical SAM protein [Ignatzschineria cameli]PWD86349.1 lysine 2,3-aminomutase [Ignatzschineria cameli]PWD89813.1 lysine 2,3-aminomutase [Ignatzschineria cameli]PWD91463.1 lysine 2,3-aminomutase [Ignatzschineria cameli]PWD92501.1 lysine 2,3-aminomutase [Ignatzschineria cameli]